MSSSFFSRLMSSIEGLVPSANDDRVLQQEYSQPQQQSKQQSKPAFNNFHQSVKQKRNAPFSNGRGQRQRLDQAAQDDNDLLERATLQGIHQDQIRTIFTRVDATLSWNKRTTKSRKNNHKGGKRVVKKKVTRLTYSDDDEDDHSPQQAAMEYISQSASTIGAVALDFENLVEGVKGSKQSTRKAQNRSQKSNKHLLPIIKEEHQRSEQADLDASTMAYLKHSQKLCQEVSSSSNNNSFTESPCDLSDLVIRQMQSQRIESRKNRDSVVSVCANQDRLSVLVHNKLDDFEDSDDNSDPSDQQAGASTEGGTPQTVAKIYMRSKTLTQKHMKLSRKYHQMKQYDDDSFDFSAEQALVSGCEWHDILQQTEPLTVTQKEKVRHTLIFQGVPDKLRGEIWIKLLEIDHAEKVHSQSLYGKLLEFSNPEAENQIQKDVDRTMSELQLWREDHQGGNNKLYNVLKAYANYDNEVGYVQGLNYIVGLLLFYISDEEKVFWCLHQLLQRRNWRNVYTPDFPRMKELSQFLEDRLEQEFPMVLRHLNENWMEVQAVFTPHFMTLFVYLTPIEIATRLFEVFILDGDLAIVRLLLKMIELKQGELLKRRETELQGYVLSGMIIECVEEYSISYLLDIN